MVGRSSDECNHFPGTNYIQPVKLQPGSICMYVIDLWSFTIYKSRTKAWQFVKNPPSGFHLRLGLVSAGA